MEILRLVLLLLAGIRLLQPNAVCACQVAEVFHDLACHGHPGETGDGSRCCHAETGSDAAEAGKAAAAEDPCTPPSDPLHQIPGQGCSRLIALPVSGQGAEKTNGNGSPYPVILPFWNRNGPGLDDPVLLPSGPPAPVWPALARRFLLKRALLL